MRKAVVLRVVAVVAVAGLLAAAATREPVRAELRRWWNHGAPEEIRLSGNIEAHESQLSFKGVQSRIVQLPFDEGQAVQRGALVAVLDSAELQQQVTMAEAASVVQQRQFDAALKNLEAARRVIEADRAELAQRELDLRRATDLQQQGFVSAAALDGARTALAQTRAVLARDEALEQLAARNVKVAEAGTRSADEALRLARLVRGNATLTAPFDGVVLSRQAEVGEVVAPGTPIVTLADLDHVWVRAYLNETDLGRIRLGQEAHVSADGLRGQTLVGRVSFIAPQAEFTPKSVETHAERVTLVYRIKVELDNRQRLLVPGMPVDVRLTPAAR
jgi:membrane fusion protein YbhG